jgi:RNA polymerase sigma-70 factor (ECF subfamily)
VNQPEPIVGIFATPHWSLVLSAGGDSSPLAREALERLCRAYWFPLYAHVRAKGFSPEDAEDLTQEFFARFLASNALRTVSQERGRFRAFLLASLNHFLANEWDRLRAQKRGAGQKVLALDAASAEERLKNGTSHQADAGTALRTPLGRGPA